MRVLDGARINESRGKRGIKEWLRFGYSTRLTKSSIATVAVYHESCACALMTFGASSHRLSLVFTHSFTKMTDERQLLGINGEMDG